MKSSWCWLAALLVCCTMTQESQAGYPYFYPSNYPSTPQAPDARGCGYYVTNPGGMVYGPNYCVYPCFPPYNGERPPLQGNAPQFRSHPFARSPRDFFMLD